MSRTGVRLGRIAASGLAIVLVASVAGRAAGGPVDDAGKSVDPAVERVAGDRHLVRSGDTLWELARRAVGPDADPRPMVEALRRANGLDSPALRPGTTLVIPVSP